MMDSICGGEAAILMRQQGFGGGARVYCVRLLCRHGADKLLPYSVLIKMLLTLFLF